ncbi:hypothetical protein ABIE28_004266, partial [Devosia sp. 2618]
MTFLLVTQQAILLCQKRRTVGENFISQRRQRGRVVIETPKSVNNLFS